MSHFVSLAATGHAKCVRRVFGCRDGIMRMI